MIKYIESAYTTNGISVLLHHLLSHLCFFNNDQCVCIAMELSLPDPGRKLSVHTANTAFIIMVLLDI